ncbi:MAG: cation diffusion facilitator family transporter [Thermoplasmata archaeon]
MRPRVIIVATVILDAGLFVVNAYVAYYSGSHAVLSQAIYTVTDLIGGLLIFWGLLISNRPPDQTHPFGFGKDRFFWSFSSSLVTFTAAGLIVLVSGFQQALSPSPVDHVPYAILVVGITLAVSLAGIWITLRELRHGRETLSDLLESAQLGLKTIFYQDLVSVVGSGVAFVGLFLVQYTHNAAVDGITAMGVGLLLIVTGVVAAAESRELLIGKAISPENARRILQVVERDARVRQVRGLQSMMLGPDDVLVALRVNFQDGLTTDQIESAIDTLAVSLRSVYPTIRHLVIEPES